MDQKYHEEINRIMLRYPHRQAALAALLWMVQDREGHITLSAQQEIADLLGVSAAHVFGVASFHTLYKKKPVGRYHLQLCRTLCCALKGCEDLIRHLLEKHHLTDGSISKDGLFSLELVECLASCGTGPAMRVNDSLIENLTVAKLDELIDRLARE